jgi:hypothetical protein
MITEAASTSVLEPLETHAEWRARDIADRELWTYRLTADAFARHSHRLRSGGRWRHRSSTSARHAASSKSSSRGTTTSPSSRSGTRHRTTSASFDGE